MIQTALIISLASLGFRAITGKGMIFYFMREWLDKWSASKSGVEKSIKTFEAAYLEAHKNTMTHNVESSQYEKFRIERNRLHDDIDILKKMLPSKFKVAILYFMKPVILCGTCMASLHTLIWFPYLMDGYTFDIIIVMMMVALMNTFIWSFIEWLQSFTKLLDKESES